MIASGSACQTNGLGFVGAGKPHRRMLELSAIFMLLTFVAFVGYGMFAASTRHVIAPLIHAPA